MEDQKKISDQISQNSSVIAGASASNGKKKGKKRAADSDAKMTDVASKDFGVEYAASSRAECRGCQIKISKGEVRIKKVVFDTEVGMKYGGQPLWHHVECFAKVICLYLHDKVIDKLRNFLFENSLSVSTKCCLVSKTLVYYFDLIILHFRQRIRSFNK